MRDLGGAVKRLGTCGLASCHQLMPASNKENEQSWGWAVIEAPCGGFFSSVGFRLVTEGAKNVKISGCGWGSWRQSGRRCRIRAIFGWALDGSRLPNPTMGELSSRFLSTGIKIPGCGLLSSSPIPALQCSNPSPFGYLDVPNQSIAELAPVRNGRAQRKEKQPRNAAPDHQMIRRTSTG